ncbi:MAG: SUMF1/EgtB/PvdO family nonheme iron enzyme [Deltaproteobacteria bacterium]|nr:SUMF1/EgtB/PvdO family nonheme iron enzyme [Deltaproteobacteria bacterium]
MESRWDIEKQIGTDVLPRTIVSPIDGAEMVLIPESDFTMGISEEQLAQIFLVEQKWNPVFATETPARKIYLESYYIDRYPVTNYQYRKFIEETGHREPMLWHESDWNQPLQPVVFVGWEDARAYAKWAGKSLPTEAQWEKAGRGIDGRLWAWGQVFLPDRCNCRDYGLDRTSEIGTFDQGVSPYGCYDMCGNVWEMCEGRWIEDLPVMRGGCFLGSPTFVRVTCRWSPEDVFNGAHWLGFRCVKNLASGQYQ